MKLAAVVVVASCVFLACERDRDTDPPLVVGTLPADGDSNVVSDTVTVWFSEAMNHEATRAALRVDTAHTVIDAAFPYPDRLVFRVAPDSGVVAATIDGSAEDDEGNRLGMGAFTFSFSFVR